MIVVLYGNVEVNKDVALIVIVDKVVYGLIVFSVRFNVVVGSRFVLLYVEFLIFVARDDRLIEDGSFVVKDVVGKKDCLVDVNITRFVEFKVVVFFISVVTLLDVVSITVDCMVVLIFKWDVFNSVELSC